jgi:hypothetical protein
MSQSDANSRPGIKSSQRVGGAARSPGLTPGLWLFLDRIECLLIRAFRFEDGDPADRFIGRFFCGWQPLIREESGASVQGVPHLVRRHPALKLKIDRGDSGRAPESLQSPRGQSYPVVHAAMQSRLLGSEGNSRTSLL